MLCVALVLFCATGTLAAPPAPSIVKSGSDSQKSLARARALASAGETTEAVALYRRVVAQAPKNADARREFARLLVRNKETRAEAEKSYAKLVVMLPRDADVIAERGVNLAALGEEISALFEYNRALEIAPDNSFVLQSYVELLERLGAVPITIKQNLAKLAVDPNDFAAHLLVAELQRSEALYTEAIEHYGSARRLAPTSYTALRGVAEAWLALGYCARAKELFDQTGNRTSAEKVVAEARVLLAMGRAEAALGVLKAAELAKIEDSSALLLLRADAFRTLRQTTQELQTLEKPVSYQPRAELQMLARLARVRTELGDREGARNACERLLNLDPHNAIGAFGLSLLDGGFQTPSATKPVNSIPSRLFGRERETADAALFWNNPQQALPHIRQALVLQPDSIQMQFALGQSLLQLKDADGAATAFASVPIIDGPRLDALLGSAQAEMSRGNPQRALENYQFALRLDPNSFKALSGQAEALRLLGENERAATLLVELSRRAPESRWVKLRLVEVLAALGRSYEITVAQAPPHADRPAEIGSSPQPLRLNNRSEPLLGAGDIVRVRIIGRTEVNADVQLDEDGSARLPFLEEKIGARCLTPRELSGEIVKQGGAKLAGATIETSVIQYRRAPVTIAGAVYLPGSYYVRVPLNLREALMLASGADARAGRNVYILRGAGACERPNSEYATDRIEMYDREAAEAGRIELRQPLRVGDVVLVPERNTAFIAGAVARPDSIITDGSLRLLEAIEKLGGALPDARRERVRLMRLLPDNSAHQEFIINLIDIEQKRIGEVLLQPGDIVEIPTADRTATVNSFAKLLQRIALGAQPPANGKPPVAIIKK